MLYWVAPVSVLAYQVIASTVSFLMLQRPSADTPKKHTKYYIVALLATVDLTFVSLPSFHCR